MPWNASHKIMILDDFRRGSCLGLPHPPHLLTPRRSKGHPNRLGGGQNGEMGPRQLEPTYVLKHSQMIHVWYIYLQNWVIYIHLWGKSLSPSPSQRVHGVNVGKYAIHGWSGIAISSK